MPGNARQASRALLEAVGAGPLSPPTGHVVFALTAPAQVAADYDLDFAGKAGLSFRVKDVWIVKTGAGEGAVASTIQLQTLAGVAISDAISLNGVADQTIVRGAAINDANHTIAAGGGLRLRHHINAGTVDASCIVYVEAAILSVSLGQAFQSSRQISAIGAGQLPSPPMLATLALTIPNMATGNVDFTGVPGLGFRIVDVEVVKTANLGGGVNTVQVQTAAGVPITNAIDINIADTAISRALTIDAANHAFAAGAGLRVAVVRAAGDTACIVYLTVALTVAGAHARAQQSSEHLVQNLAAAGLPNPALEIVFACTTPQVAGNVDFTGIPGFAFRVIDVEFLKTDAAAGGASTLQLQTAGGANNVTDAANINVAAGVIVKVATIDDARHLFAAGTGFRIVTTGGDCRGIAYLRCAIV